METKLKVKLEDIVLLGESITKLAQEVYSLHKKIVNEEELKIQTKEQIDIIYNCSALRGDIQKGVISIIITEWEKIRNNYQELSKSIKLIVGLDG